MTKNGKPLILSIVVCQDFPIRITVAETIKSQLAQIGITLLINKVDYGTYQKILSEKSYQLIITGIANSVNPSLEYFFGENNIANFKNNDIQQKINDLNSYQEIQRIANQQVVYIPLYRNKGVLLLNANVGGSFTPTSFNIYNNFDKWYRQR